tara:strand:+ start:733 stop:963 length:231 start_codon:yes stop_codon:yes gene_type:complete
MTADEIRAKALDVQQLSSTMHEASSAFVYVNGKPVVEINPKWLDYYSKWLGEHAIELSKHAVELANQQGTLIVEKS